MGGSVTLFAEGRLPETFRGWSRVRRLRARENVSRALGRLRGTARRALGPGREELADARGNSPPRSAAWSRKERRGAAPRGERALSERAARRDWSARQRTGRG